MKAAAYLGVKNIKIVDVKKPEVQDNGVLIKMRACGICGSDMHVYNSGLLMEDSTKIIDDYRIIGHEFTGEIIAVGKDVKGFKVGDRVASVHNKGGMAEYIDVHGDRLKNLFKIPEGVKFETAATLEPLCNPIHSFHLREPKENETVAIFGAGIIGLSYLQIIKTNTKARAIIVDVSKLRLDIAKKCGADIIINTREENAVKKIKEITGDYYVRYQKKSAGGCAVAIDCAGIPLTLLQCLEVLSPENGIAIIAAIYEDEVNIEPNMVVFKYMTIYGSMGYFEHETREALGLIASGKVNRDILITHKLPLEKAGEGFVIQGNPSEAVKVVLINE